MTVERGLERKGRLRKGGRFNACNVQEKKERYVFDSVARIITEEGRGRGGVGST
jgi:hypothetical protein